MTGLLGGLFQLSWVLGLLSILAGVVVKLLHYESRASVTGRTLFIIASTFFLCALATREMQRAKSLP
jgi:hypothetical protein